MSAITENAVSRHRLTVEVFHRMGEVGIFLEDDRVELIDGEIIDMAPIGSKHAASSPSPALSRRVRYRSALSI